MPLSEKARERLADVRELEPTSNRELRDRWGMDSGKEVAAYLREELGEYVYRDDDSRIRAVAEADAPAGDGAAESSASNPGSTTAAQHGTSENEASPEGDTSSVAQEAPQEQAQHGVGWTITAEEFDQAIEAAREAGYEDGYHEALADAPTDDDLEEMRAIGYEEGYQDGYKAARQELNGGGTGGLPTAVEEPQCHSCGGELYDFTGFATGQYHKLNGKRVYVQGDYQCSSCGKWWVDEEPATA